MEIERTAGIAHDRLAAAVVVIAIVGIFLFGTQRFSSPLDDPSLFELGGSEISVAEGNQVRRVLFLTFAFVGLGLLVSRSENRICLRLNSCKLLFFFFFWCFCSVFWSINPSISFRRYVLYCTFVIAALGVSKRFNKLQIVQIIFSVSSTFLLIGIFNEFRLGTFIVDLSFYRFSGTMHPNAQGINSAIVIFSGLSLLSWKFSRFEFSGISRKFTGITITIAFLILFLTKSRTSFAALLICVLLTFFVSIKKQHRVAAIFLGCMVFASVFLSGGLTRVLLEDVVFMGRSGESTKTLVGRIPLWSMCWEYIQARPLSGYGYNVFWSETRVYELYEDFEWNPQSAHSAYLEILLGVGAIGLCALLAATMVGIKRSVVSVSSGGMFFLLLSLFALFHGVLESGVLFATYLEFPSFVFLVVVTKMTCFSHR